MALYTGTLPTRLLNDQQIRPGSYRTWSDVARDFERRDKDREILADLKASIPVAGQQKPILLEVDDRHHDVRVADGHHRSLILRQLGVAEFTFRWCLIGTWSVKDQSGPFPYHLLGL
ncbi:ParB N-terminal domain-containing protein [Streptomyces venezuelae]|uniref:ParB N-terminal domain-containing protein n=1 Tax=Streptomyces sp. B6(2022) TaxID=3404749 RepID=UPI00311F6629